MNRDDLLRIYRRATRAPTSGVGVDVDAIAAEVAAVLAAETDEDAAAVIAWWGTWGYDEAGPLRTARAIRAAAADPETP